MATIEQKIKSAKKLSDEIKIKTQSLSELKAEIQKYFDSNNIKQFIVEPSLDEASTTIATVSERVYITYDGKKLKEKLSAELFNEVTSRVYMIVDMKGLTALLKSAGVRASEFRRMISIETTVNTDMLKQLYAVGDISLKDIEDCYTAKVSKSITLTEREGVSN